MPSSAGKKKEEAADYWRLDPEALRVVGNGVDLDHVRPDAALGRRERRALGFAGRVLLSVGRVVRLKGSATLLETYTLSLHDALPIWCLLAASIRSLSPSPPTAMYS